MKSRVRLERWVVGAGVLLIAAFTGSTAYDVWRLNLQVRTANERELGNLARALADESARSFQAVDVLLRDTSTWYQTTGQQLSPDAIATALASRAVGVSQVSVLTIVDASGRQRYRSRETGEPFADVSDRPYFQIQRDHAETGMFINEPVVTRTERLAALVVSRRIVDADGRFDGLVTATVTLLRVRSMFDAIDLGDGSALLLALDDGTLVVRQPPIAGLELKQRIPEVIALKGGAVIDRLVSPVDGRVKLISAVGVGNRALTLAILRDEQVAMLPFRDAMWGAVVRAGVLCLLVVLTTIGLLRQVRRLDRGASALRQSEERYAMAMAAANEGHAEWNILQDTVFASDKWRALHGIEGRTLASSLDVQLQTSIHPEDLPSLRTSIKAHLEGCSPAIETEYRVRHPDGRWHWIHARGRCLTDSNSGKALRLFCSAIDVTPRKDAEASKADLEARLHQTRRLEALGTLSGGIAHDFNNILGAILGFGQMAQQQAEPDSRMRRHLDRVMQAGGRARLLVRQILDFSRSGVTLREAVNIQEVVEEVVAMLRPTLASDLGMDCRLETGNAAVTGDATQLYQVVMNLCTNALQAIGESGTVTISLTHTILLDPGPLPHGALHPGPHVRLEVSDTGVGIEPQAIARMFDPFFTTKKVGEGTGLGLSVVHGIVVDMGGAIDVRSQPGEGTTVSIWLPVTGESEVSVPLPAAEWPRGGGEVVMLVDDESALVELTEELLAQIGYDPVGFTSAEIALAAFCADPSRFDAVLTDETMPGMSGTALADCIHRHRADLPIILMSGNVREATERLASEVGIRELLRKPLALQDLAECLARVLPGTLHPSLGGDIEKDGHQVATRP